MPIGGAWNVLLNWYQADWQSLHIADILSGLYTHIYTVVPPLPFPNNFPRVNWISCSGCACVCAGIIQLRPLSFESDNLMHDWSEKVEFPEEEELSK